jgi:hypothetical protein
MDPIRQRFKAQIEQQKKQFDKAKGVLGGGSDPDN